MSAEMDPPRCFSRRCKHFRGVEELVAGDESSQVVTCAAFPRGIPNEIAFGPNLHLTPVEGDHGIQFELDRTSG